MKRASSLIYLLAFAFAISTSPLTATAEPLAAAGIPNFHRVNDRLYRGGQPTDQGWTSLAKLGVRTVIDLRQVSEHSTTGEARAVEAAGMRYFNLPMDGFETPRPDQLAKALDLIDSGDTVFVHCKQGRDRTGTIVAVYRMEREGWNSHKALEEAESCGIHWFSLGMKRLIRGYHPASVDSLSQVARLPTAGSDLRGSGSAAEQAR